MNLSVTDVFSNPHCCLLTRNASQIARCSGTHPGSKRCSPSVWSKVQRAPKPILWGHWDLAAHTDTSSVPLRFPLMYQNGTRRGERGLWKRPAAAKPDIAHHIPAKKCYWAVHCWHCTGSKVTLTVWLILESFLQKLRGPRKTASLFRFNINQWNATE